ncbi:MAG: hypothetical protein ACRENC_12285, partial [Gemmatimonadaceae bacterium]
TVDDPRAIAAGAVAVRPGRPATAIVHDSADARVVVFRLAPGEEVAPHTRPSTVMPSPFAVLATIAPRPGTR